MPSRRPNLSVSINKWSEGGVNLVDTASAIRIDTANRGWQLIEIPLDESAKQIDTLYSINILSNVRGDFRIDDIRLTRKQVATNTLIAVGDLATEPSAFQLLPNAPNPFNSSTVLRYTLDRAGEVSLSIYNLAGQRVATLPGTYQEPGSYRIQFDGRDDAGRALASGTYFYQLTVGDRTQTRKLMLLR